MRLIIVGSGIVGAACAYTACGLGAQVTLVDAAWPGQATAAGAGIICPWTAAVDDPAWYAFGRAAARQYPALIADLEEQGESDVSYAKVGALLVGDGDQLEQARQRLTARRAAAPEIGEVALIDDRQARELFPPLHPGATALFIPGAARVDGRRLAAALIRAATRLGATTRTGEAKLAYRQARTGEARLANRAGHVTGVTVDGELLEADAVVVAAGAWTAPLLAPLGVTVRVVPQRGQIVHIGLDGTDTSRWPVVLPSATGHYLLAFDGSRVVAGATRETDSGFDVRVTPGGLAEVLANALSVAPGLSAGTLLETRVGLRPAGPDIRPLLGPVSGVDNLIVATGLGASGLTMGPLAGAVAARIAIGQPPDQPNQPPDQPNQPPDQPNQPNRPNPANQTDRTNQTDQPDLAAFDPLR
jgi:D-amino-acid dehydrogenase